MAWSASKIFSSFVTDSFAKTSLMDINSDTINAALYDTSVTPDQTVASASSAYNAGVWAAGHLTDTGTSAPAGWPTVGRPLVTPTCTFASNVVTFDAVDTVSANAVTTIAAAFGTLIYSDTIASPVAKQGICYLYFGGTQSVTLGTLTLVWAGAGLAAVTL
ncbi:MAG: hypothetical protein WAN48_11505 [Actinomycetes bacterium]